MAFFKAFRKDALLSRKFEEELYAIVMDEISTGIRKEGIWGKALAKSEGDETKAQSLYITYRVQSLKDELELSKYIVEDKSDMLQRPQSQEYTSRSNDVIKKAVNALKTRKYYADEQEYSAWIVYCHDGSCVRLDSDNALLDYAKSICGDDL